MKEEHFHSATHSNNNNKNQVLIKEPGGFSTEQGKETISIRKLSNM